MKKTHQLALVFLLFIQTFSAIGQLSETEKKLHAEVVKELYNELVFVEPGNFKMGDPNRSIEANDNPAHDVRMCGYAISKYEITQSQWNRIMNNSKVDCPTCPVFNISYSDVQAFLRKLNLVIQDKPDGGGFRLPTEAEWEYAAMGGKKSKGYTFAGSNNPDLVSWNRTNSADKIHPVGLKLPNELGLYDMSGNVFEWCDDWYGRNYYVENDAKNCPNGPQFPNSYSEIIFRGGSYLCCAICEGSSFLSPKIRTRYNLKEHDADLGFRLVFPISTASDLAIQSRIKNLYKQINNTPIVATPKKNETEVFTAQLDEPETFTCAAGAIDYLRENFLYTPEKKEGKKWTNIFGVQSDDDYYFMLSGKGIGNVFEKEMREMNEDNEEELAKKITKVENFKSIGIKWEEIKQVSTQVDARGDSWLNITGPVELVDEKKIIANSLRLYVWPEKRENIKNAILFLSKSDLSAEADRKADLIAKLENEKKLEIKAQRDFDNYQFTSISDAINYLEKVLGCDVHQQIAQDKSLVPYPYKYMLIKHPEAGYQDRYFVFSTIAKVEESDEQDCASCGNLLKVTVPVYFIQSRNKYKDFIYFNVHDRGNGKAIKAFRYLRANLSFAEPERN